MNNTSSIRDFIAASAWFEDAPDAILEKLSQAAKLKRYHANSYLWSMGETNTEIFGVVTGRVRMYASSPV